MEGLWQYAIGPIAVAIGGALTLWWQSRTSKADKDAEQERQRDHDDLSELRAYRARIDEELQKCRASEVGLRADLAALSTKAAALEVRVESLTADLTDAISALKAATERLDAIEIEKAELEVSVNLIARDRDVLKARMDQAETEARLRKQGALKTRATDKRKQP